MTSELTLMSIVNFQHKIDDLLSRIGMTGCVAAARKLIALVLHIPCKHSVPVVTSDTASDSGKQTGMRNVDRLHMKLAETENECVI